MKLFLSFSLATLHLTDARILGYTNEDGALANINSDLVPRDQNQIGRSKVFHIENQMLSWSDHNLLAKKQGYALASIHSEEDMKVILELTSNDKDYWIGGRRSATQNQVWTWSDGSPWDFTGWYLGEPNHAIEGEDCVEAYHPNLVKQQWVDNPCDQKNMAIYYRPRFHVDATELSWHAHNARAIAQGYVLASVHSLDDMMYIRDAIALKGLTVETLAWIGLKRKSNNSKTWLWTDGSPLDFTDWIKNEPNNQGGQENCVEYRENYDAWNDNTCTRLRTAIYMVKPKYETRFHVDATELTWHAHNARAIAQGYVLASVHSLDDMMYIRDAIALKGLPVKTVAWIGLKRKSNNSKTWVWTDGSPLDFTDWIKNEPNNARGQENCVEYKESYDGWNDNTCTYLRTAIYMVKPTDETKIW